MSQTVFNAILNRRSVSPKKLASPGPTAEQVQCLIEAACAAPDHGRLRPTHFVYIPDDKRERLADVFEAAALEANPDADEKTLSRARTRSYNAPCLLAMIVSLDKERDDVPVHEQWLSAGASMQNVLLLAVELGYSAIIVSGIRVRSRSMRDAFYLEDNQVLAGFIAVGSASEADRSQAAHREHRQAIECWS